MLEAPIDELLRLGPTSLPENVERVMAEWERQKFEREAVESGFNSALVGGLL